MTVTFIAHSAYLVEWDKFYTLFDYTYEPDYTGALPRIRPSPQTAAFMCVPAGSLLYTSRPSHHSFFHWPDSP